MKSDIFAALNSPEQQFFSKHHLYPSIYLVLFSSDRNVQFYNSKVNPINLFWISLFHISAPAHMQKMGTCLRKGNNQQWKVWQDPDWFPYFQLNFVFWGRIRWGKLSIYIVLICTFCFRILLRKNRLAILSQELNNLLPTSLLVAWIYLFRWLESVDKQLIFYQPAKLFYAG